MFARLFICLVFITTVTGNDLTTSHKSSSRLIVNNQENTGKYLTESLNESPGTAQSMKITENKTNSAGNATKETIIKEQDKNGTATKKPQTEIEGMTAESSQTVISYPPYSTYEVTENVIDIPDDRPLAGPIVTNYTVRPPTLNLVKPNNKTDNDKTTEANIKTKKNHLSILHINADFDDKVHVVNENKVVGIFKGIKKYLHSFKRGIVNSFHSFFHKYQDVHDHGDRFKRAADEEEKLLKRDNVQNLDKTEYFVHRRHISMT